LCEGRQYEGKTQKNDTGWPRRGRRSHGPYHVIGRTERALYEYRGGPLFVTLCVEETRRAGQTLTVPTLRVFCKLPTIALDNNTTTIAKFSYGIHGRQIWESWDVFGRTALYIAVRFALDKKAAAGGAGRWRVRSGLVGRSRRMADGQVGGRRPRHGKQWRWQGRVRLGRGGGAAAERWDVEQPPVQCGSSKMEASSCPAGQAGWAVWGAAASGWSRAQDRDVEWPGSGRCGRKEVVAEEDGVAPGARQWRVVAGLRIG